MTRNLEKILKAEKKKIHIVVEKKRKKRTHIVVESLNVFTVPTTKQPYSLLSWKKNYTNKVIVLFILNNDIIELKLRRAMNYIQLWSLITTKMKTSGITKCK